MTTKSLFFDVRIEDRKLINMENGTIPSLKW